MRLKWVVSGILATTTVAVCIGQYIEDSSIEKSLGVRSYRWNITSNGFECILEYAVVNNRVSGTLGYLHGGQPESNQIEGYQVGRNIVFYRHSAANQIWTGWIGETSFGGNSGPTIAGTFSHLGENSYPWYGLQDVNGYLPDDSIPGGR